MSSLNHTLRHLWHDATAASPATSRAGLATLVVVGASVLVAFLRWLALPRPLPGIPYNKKSARNLLGDVPAMLEHIDKQDGTFISYIEATLRALDAPLVQVFIKPMGKPLLVLADYRESHDVMTRRTKEFDRSTSSGDLVRGLAPDHHIHLKTTPAWRLQRRLVQDLMTPNFLHKVAGPAIHQNAMALIDLWRAKSRVADGRPWAAAGDIENVALDAVLAFAFGDGFARKHSATRPTLEAVEGMDPDEAKRLRSRSRDDPVEWPKGRMDEVISATLELGGTVKEVQGSPLPNLKWAYVNNKPRIRRARKIKEDYVAKEITDAVRRLQGADQDDFVKSAVDYMVSREKVLAEKDDRKPDYFSRIMMDEVFGFVVAGNDTSSSTINWGIKYLSDSTTAQTKLRNAMEAAFPAAASEGRSPRIKELTGTPIPYLDATVEEIARLAASVPVVDRQATVDTQVLGYHIPKGTAVTSLVTGPSMTSPAFEIDEARRSEASRAAEKEGAGRRGGGRVRGTWDPRDMASFKPERWLVGPDGKDFDAAAGPQLAFGLGTRQCYGKRLAYMKMKILVALIVWNFELLPCPAALSNYKPLLIMTSRPKTCYVRLREMRRPGGR